MEKKEYTAPVIRVYRIEQHSLLATISDPNTIPDPEFTGSGQGLAD